MADRVCEVTVTVVLGIGLDAARMLAGSPEEIEEEVRRAARAALEEMFADGAVLDAALRTREVLRRMVAEGEVVV